MQWFFTSIPQKETEKLNVFIKKLIFMKTDLLQGAINEQKAYINKHVVFPIFPTGN
jgi:hypothetical protein